MKKKNFTEGAIFTPMLTFTMPIILTNVLQTMYSIADNVIVGKFSGDTLALAAVGTSGSLSSLFLNIVIGLSTGCAVVIAHAFGASDKEKVSKSVHTALTFALIFGIALSAFSISLTASPAVRELSAFDASSSHAMPDSTAFLKLSDRTISSDAGWQPANMPIVIKAKSISAVILLSFIFFPLRISILNPD